MMDLKNFCKQNKWLVLILFSVALITALKKPSIIDIVGYITPRVLQEHLIPITNFVEEISIDRGAFATFFGVCVALYFAMKQLSSLKDQIQKRAVQSKDRALRSHMISVSEFANRYDATTGIYYEYTEEHKYAVMWRIVRQKEEDSNCYILVLLFRILSPESKVEEEIIDGCICSWWDHKVVIPRFGKKHGVLIESYNENRTDGFISEISDNNRTNIMRAMKRIQILNKEEVKGCEKRLSGSFLSDISDSYLIKIEKKSIPAPH